MLKFGDAIISFNNGAQIILPPGTGEFAYRFYDTSSTPPKLEEAGIMKRDPRQWVLHIMNRKYFIPWRVEITDADGKEFVHDFDAHGRHVLIDMSPGALGDTLAWIPAAVEFKTKWNCQLTICTREQYKCLFESCYPDIRFVIPKEADEIKANETYARYTLAVWGYEYWQNHEKMDFRRNNLQLHADMILDVCSRNLPPLVAGEPHFFEKPTVCIATRASRYCKEWHNSGGWEALTELFRKRGFDVICIDKDNKNCPTNAIDATGDKPLTERASFLRGATLFVGLPSGLSWLAWACKVPVVMIAGFTGVVRPELKEHRYPEFDTPYRVEPPKGVCHNCWPLVDWRKREIADNCWFGKDNECSKTITPQAVWRVCQKALRDAADSDRGIYLKRNTK